MDDQGATEQFVPAVRDLLRSYGIVLPNRVRVELTSAANMRLRGSGVAGYTVVAPHVASPVVREIRIVDGLPGTLFGRILAHEIGHAWLAGCPAGIRSSSDEEGICEMLAAWWLEHRGGQLASHFLHQLKNNTDAIYGDGYRQIASVAEELPPREFVRRVALTGQP